MKGPEDDPNAELWEKVAAVQDRRIQGRTPVEALLDDAVELVTLARAPRYDGCQARLCAYDQLISVYEALDPVGYAPEIATTASELREEASPSMTCWFCLGLSVARSARLSGDFAKARRVLDEARAEIRMKTYADLYYGARLAAERVRLAHAEQDARAAEAAFAQLRRFVELDRDACRGRPELASRVADDEELERELAVLVELAKGEPAAAHRAYEAGCAKDAPNPGRLLIQHELLEALLAAPGAVEPDPVPALLDDMRRFTEAQGYPRDAAKVALAEIAWCRARGGDEAPARSRLEAALPKTRAEDLRLRARELGLAVDAPGAP
ncbi:MAG TPA: hypothetical protein RMH85_19385 [Polyangiaceae bacterium LLY-WYZ-15_(1-7)]|nr:hypothetical protein [Sandaracinus sp.]HJL03307.1 hypothetical protein [Polyangiaceae bacterium LLY-WYZ-15_(1-7)]MBJ73579.1 hypothetical protein [Sandaracinus sp.]HJL10674.1 hypothetical protein [Polyangiaceae bacterium LLY-WYZ-15_(1-7)]HJL21826.1 hypothetical protein [Polyangiaceae bacterium LLY-WYZ-15_(1-7)]